MKTLEQQREMIGTILSTTEELCWHLTEGEKIALLWQIILRMNIEGNIVESDEAYKIVLAKDEDYEY